MKTKLNLSALVFTAFVLGLITSCGRENPVNDDTQENEDSQTTSCNETSFPSLGPSASSSQTCSDVSNPVNIGTLDCRTIAPGGYSQQTDGSMNYGVYKLIGSSDRYDGTKTRVERFFNRVTRGKSKYGEFTSKFVITDLSDGNTCIVQTHANGEIVEGKKKGETARSAQFLLYAKKTSDPNVFRLEIHESTTPYTTETRGARTITFFRNVFKNQEYFMRMKSGYDSNQKAFTSIRVFGSATDTEQVRLNHTYTTEDVVTRYGAYGAADSGDVSVEIRFRDTQFCRSN